MPDITMCEGTSCPLRENCYRKRAVPTPNWQSYFASAPVDKEGNCTYFWKIDKYDRLQTTNEI